METLTVALVQMDSTADRDENVCRATALVEGALRRGAQLVCLPELFTFMGRPCDAGAATEPIPGPSLAPLAELTRHHEAWVAAGSVLEENGNHLPFNTAPVLGPTGEVIARYRKMHLFELELPGQPECRESTWLSPGETPALCSTPFGVLGLSICYDLRFPELYRHYSAHGATILLVPAAFTAQTGRDHWEPLLRARAIENQCFVLAANQTGSKAGGLVCHGRSAVIDPWGIVRAQAGDDECVLFADLDLRIVSETRHRLPALAHRRLV